MKVNIDEFKEAFMKELGNQMIRHNRQLGEREYIVIDEFVKQMKLNNLELIEKEVNDEN